MGTVYGNVLLLVWCVTLALPAAAQQFPHLALQRFYDNVGDDHPQRLLRSPDGHLILAGNTIMPDSAGTRCANVWILKVDTTGERLWEQEIALTGCEELRDLVVTPDSGLLFIGVTNSLIPHEEKGDPTYWGDVLIGKMDARGTVEWLQSYGGSYLDQAYALVEGIYREYLVVGGTHSRDGDIGGGFGNSDIWTLKVDNRGQPRYSKPLGGNRDEWGLATTLCLNGDYLIAGQSNSTGLDRQPAGPYPDGVVLRVTQSGFVLWQRHFPSPWGSSLAAVHETPEGHIRVAGHRLVEGEGRNFWWMELDEQGRLRQDRVYPGGNEEYLTRLALCADGGTLFGGYSRFRGHMGPEVRGGDDFWLIRTDARGQLLWQQTYGGPQDERCADILCYRPGVYYALGEKYNQFTRSDRHDHDFWLLRIEEYPPDSIQAGIFVRARENRIPRETPTRFRAQYRYGDRFLWDFGDGTQSTEAEPLKSYRLSGMYEVRLTVFAGESCQQTVSLERELEVW